MPKKHNFNNIEGFRVPPCPHQSLLHEFMNCTFRAYDLTTGLSLVLNYRGTRLSPEISPRQDPPNSQTWNLLYVHISSSVQVERIEKRCLELFGRDYCYSVIQNVNGDICGHYPQHIVFLEYESSEKEKDT